MTAVIKGSSLILMVRPLSLVLLLLLAHMKYQCGPEQQNEVLLQRPLRRKKERKKIEKEKERRRGECYVTERIHADRRTSHVL